MKEFTNKEIKEMSLDEQRAYYKAKFEQATWAMKPKEQIIQAHESYPPYWFVSSEGYVVSVYDKEPRKLKTRYDKCGLKDKNGDRRRSNWYLQFKPFLPVYPVEQVESGNNVHVRLHVLINAHFPRTYIPEGHENERMCIHHCESASSFAPDQGEEANRAGNLRKTVESTHIQLTKLQNKTFEQEQQAINEAIADKTQIETEPGTLESLLKVLLILGVEPESAVLQTYNQNGETDFIDITRNINLLFKGSPSEGQPIKFNSDTGEVTICGEPGKIANWEKLSDSQKKEWREQFAYINYLHAKDQEQQEGGEKQ